MYNTSAVSTIISIYNYTLLVYSYNQKSGNHGVSQHLFFRLFLHQKSPFPSFMIHDVRKSSPAQAPHCFAWEYKKVPKIAIAAPRALTGWTGVWNMMMEDTMTEIRFMVFPMLNVKGEISSSDMYDTWL